MLSRIRVSALLVSTCFLGAGACGGSTSEPSGSGSSGVGASGGAGGTNGGSGAGGTNGGDVCSLPYEIGTCKAFVPRFWFNSATGRCEAFPYGGCGGNANNFESASACVERCAPGTTNACEKITCDPGRAACVFAGTRPAECLRTCAPPGACPPSTACQCAGSCPGCENCIMACVPV